MSEPPARPKIYHITHVDNLEGILRDATLVSDAAMIDRGGPRAAVGMSKIKQRRLTLPVACHPGDFVGDYVPFYFCPRSIMLYVIHCANHPDLTYRGGQGPILHLEADLHEVITSTESAGGRWTFSLSNAGANYTQFRSRVAELSELDWAAIANTDFRSPDVKEAKQAEFLVHTSFPWELVRRIGVRSAGVQSQVETLLASAAHQPRVEARREWYY